MPKITQPVLFDTNINAATRANVAIIYNCGAIVGAIIFGHFSQKAGRRKGMMAGLGLVLLVGFSAGLAAVLMAIGLAVIYAKHLLPEEKTRSHPAFRLVPVFSAGIVLCIGLVMTGIALGVINPGRFTG